MSEILISSDAVIAPRILSPEASENIEMDVWDALETIKDPCHVLSGHDLSILDLGLVNRVEAKAEGVEVGLTLTEVGCTFAYRIIEQIEDLVSILPNVGRLKAIVEPFPLWTPDRLSDRAKAHYQRTKLAFDPVRAGI